MKHYFSVLFAVFLLSSSYGYAVQPTDRPIGPPGGGNGSTFENYISQIGVSPLLDQPQHVVFWPWSSDRQGDVTVAHGVKKNGIL